MNPVTVMMPLALTPEMLAAVREDPTTKAENWETWHTNLGWLICAWDVLLQARPPLGELSAPDDRYGHVAAARDFLAQVDAGCAIDSGRAIVLLRSMVQAA